MSTISWLYHLRGSRPQCCIILLPCRHMGPNTCPHPAGVRTAAVLTPCMDSDATLLQPETFGVLVRSLVVT